MDIAIISSIQDKASINIKERLISDFGFDKIDEKFDGNEVFQRTIGNNTIENNNDTIENNENNKKELKLYTVNSKLIHSDDLDKGIDADLFIFISKHVAKEEVKSLTVHPIGNFGKAEYGGKEKTVCKAPAAYLKNIFLELEKNSHGSGYELTMEATHHGPFLEKPVLFVEIGSSEEEWVKEESGNIIAKSVMNAIEKGNKNYESVFVIGGSHYNYIANKVMLKTDMAVGHMCAKYNLENLDETMIREAMERIVPKAKFVLLDWKGLGKEKQKIVDILEKSNIEYKRSDKFF